MIRILVYWQYIPIYWDMADFAAFGHLSSDLRLQEWKFESPQSHSFHKNVNIVRIGIFHHVLSQHDKNRHAKKSTQVRWVELGQEKGLKRGNDSSETDIGPYQYIGTTPSKGYVIILGNL